MSSNKNNPVGPNDESLPIENEGPPAPPLPPRKNVSAKTGLVACNAASYENLESIQLIPSIGLGPLIGARYSCDPQNYRRDPEMALTAGGLVDQRRPENRHVARINTTTNNTACLIFITSMALGIIGFALLAVVHYGGAM